MKKQDPIIVPKGIRYLSQWESFSIPNFPCIINKTITGCGFTEYCITNSENIILCSPRKILLENKEEQHENQVYYVRNDLDKSPKVDIDLNKTTNKKGLDSETTLSKEDIKKAVRNLKLRVQTYINSCIVNNVPAKILVTYDSFRLVKDAIKELETQNVSLNDFRVVVDEWQAIFVDSTFKSDTELEFIYQLSDLQKVCFVSATPYIEKYLNELDEFKELPYYELDWETAEPLRVTRPYIEKHPCSKSIISFACDKIDQYRKGEGEIFAYTDSNGRICEIQSKEAVIYVNSVKNICDIIRKAGLTLEETNVLCSRDSANHSDVKNAFGIRTKGVEVLGKVPKRGQPHKMFTLCTRTVYLGADFYSTNAKSFVFADANVDSLTVDISLDLPQIVGRQRLDENPWKNRAELYVKTISEGNIETEEQLDARIDKKDKATYDLLNAWNDTRPEAKHSLAENYLYTAKTANYKTNYVSVSVHNGKDLVPVFNKYVRISERRAWELQQRNYKDDITVFDSLKEGNDVGISEVDRIIQDLKSYTTFPEKMKRIYDLNLPDVVANAVLKRLPIDYGNFYRSVSPENAKRMSYRKNALEKKYTRSINNQAVDKELLLFGLQESFVIGNRYSKSEIKEKLGDIYRQIKLDKTPKATDLEEYFQIKRCAITVDEKRVEGIEILGMKVED